MIHTVHYSSQRTQTLVARWSAVCLVAILSAASFAPIASADEPPEGFTTLFNGRDLTGWKGLVGTPETRPGMSDSQLAEEQKKADALAKQNWVIDDGALLYKGDSYDNLVTTREFGDFELLVDWKIEPDADSGLYLRGSPQVQIWDGGANPIGSGGLYNNQKNPSKPTTNADKPAGEWNTFRIRMVGEKVSVWLNDELVVDEVTLENYWDRNKPIYARGPIELQAHTTKVWFRNIYIKPL